MLLNIVGAPFPCSGRDVGQCKPQLLLSSLRRSWKQTLGSLEVRLGYQSTHYNIGLCCSLCNTWSVACQEENNKVKIFPYGLDYCLTNNTAERNLEKNLFFWTWLLFSAQLRVAIRQFWQFRTLWFSMRNAASTGVQTGGMHVNHSMATPGDYHHMIIMVLNF